jgi:hypothetical protein
LSVLVAWVNSFFASSEEKSEPDIGSFDKFENQPQFGLEFGVTMIFAL